MKIFDEPLFSFFSTITLVSLVNSTQLSLTLVLGVIDLGPLSRRSNARALSAASETFAHSAADADEPLAAACCNFLNSDCNGGLN